MGHGSSVAHGTVADTIVDTRIKVKMVVQSFAKTLARLLRIQIKLEIRYNSNTIIQWPTRFVQVLKFRF